MQDRLKKEYQNETESDWHPYPENKPKEEKEYLISFYDCTRKQYGVDIDFYNPEHDVWDVYGDGVYTRVLAWAEKPEPYSKEMKNKKRRASERKEETISNNLAQTNNPRRP